ncbi:mitochondrial inner membrane protease atp23 [Rhypophila decipiens]|uniref:Mitochondrial inner membrane protease ATP23 n=1 Tax=Rhypophila decipiens TaxID=261697 RepID=A0AAN7BB00_9PEZI|nr:mitochondrial inner membrane protease atp23 [Rhypophila decipiens]
MATTSLSSSSAATQPTAQSSPEPSSSVNLGPSPPKFLENDPARTGYDPSINWWMNYFKILTGKITPEGIEHYREDQYKIHEERDVKKCEENRDWLFKHSPTIRFLQEKIYALNGDIDASNVVCRRCPARIDDQGRVHRVGGGFSPDHGILICSNLMRDRSHLEDTLAHEMVHAWDHLRWKVDWVGRMDLRHTACTEIRASMLSGECRWTRESFTRGNWGLTQQFQNCVRSRAVMSVMNRPTCKDDKHAVRVVNEVWDSCFNDKRPFEEIYR